MGPEKKGDTLAQHFIQTNISCSSKGKQENGCAGFVTLLVPRAM